MLPLRSTPREMIVRIGVRMVNMEMLMTFRPILLLYLALDVCI